MEPRTLVLSPWMQPHDVLSWKAAVVLVVDGKVDVLESYQATVASAGNRYEGRAPLVLDVPAVLRLRKAERMYRDGVKYSWPNILVRDGCRCCYCGKHRPPDQLNADHVLPRARGGQTTWLNIVAACYPCNTRKGSRTPQEAGMRVHFQPYRPSPGQFTGQRRVLFDVGSAPALWLPYLQQTAATA
jgi:5-methylcytosine-specific restriction endonuclease McrA